MLCRRRGALPYFYPRPPRGGRHYGCALPDDLEKISIHALREEGDVPLCAGCKTAKKFLSTPSARRATPRQRHQARAVHISIHALREEGDKSAFGHTLAMTKFLSTPSARRATRRRGERMDARRISIHALREEGDLCIFPNCMFLLFLSTPSARRATRLRLVLLLRFLYFYPRPPRGGRPG